MSKTPVGDAKFVVYRHPTEPNIILVIFVKQVKLYKKYKINGFVEEKKYNDKSAKMPILLYNDSKK